MIDSIDGTHIWYCPRYYATRRPRPLVAFPYLAQPRMEARSRSLGSDPRYVGSEEVDTVAVEVSACAVVVLGGAGVGVAGADLGVA